jgi:hypothetical protein
MLGPAHGAGVHPASEAPVKFDKLQRSSSADTARSIALPCELLHDLTLLDWIATAPFTVSAAVEDWREGCQTYAAVAGNQRSSETNKVRTQIGAIYGESSHSDMFCLGNHLS